MRKTLLLVSAALIALALLISGLAAAGGNRGGDGQPEPPAPTVSPMGPGEDYKSEPAPGETLEHPDGQDNPSDQGMTMAEAQQKIDPGNDPSILICKRRDGSFATAQVRWATPEAAAEFQRSNNKTKGYGLINDGGMCEEESEGS